MRHKSRIDLFDNPLKKNVELLEQKNRLEAEWYDREAKSYWEQLTSLPGLMPMDRDFETWFSRFYDKRSIRFEYDRDYRFFSLFGSVEGQDILELGFGNGCLSRFLLRRRATVFSIDLSKAYCDFLKLSKSDANSIRSCAELLPFKGLSFDVVTSFVALHHFNLALAIPEMGRVLKSGGRGIFMEPLSDSRLLNFARQLIPVKNNESPGGGGIYSREFIPLLKLHELNCRIYKYELLTRLERIGPMKKLQDKLRRIDHALLSSLPALKNFARVAVIEVGKP